MLWDRFFPPGAKWLLLGLLATICFCSFSSADDADILLQWQAFVITYFALIECPDADLIDQNC
jgi:hypothetical protein